MATRSRHASAGDTRAPGLSSAAVRGLYYITSDLPQLGRTHEGLAVLATAGGSRLVQFREKSGDGVRQLEAARAVREVCRTCGALFIVNDDPTLAVELDADGLHLGQSDLHRLDEWRHFTSHWGDGGQRARLLGVSAASVDEAVRAVELGADHLGVGPIFPTPSKADAIAPIGLEGLRAIRETVDVPLAAIGGVCASNAAEVLAAGADALCVMSAVSTADDPRGAAQQLAGICVAYGADGAEAMTQPSDETRVTEWCDG